MPRTNNKLSILQGIDNKTLTLKGLDFPDACQSFGELSFFIQALAKGRGFIPSHRLFVFSNILQFPNDF